jgi:hypothetical protein
MNLKCSELDNMNNSLDYYNSIKSVSDDLFKYIKSYKQINQEYLKKLQSTHSNYKKKLTSLDNPKTNQIIKALTSKLTLLIDQSIELYQLSIDDIDLRLKEFESFIKNKTESIKSVQKSAAEITKMLNNGFNETSKAKTNYLNSLSKAEDVISKYYSDTNRIKEHESGLGQKLNENEYMTLKEQLKNQKVEMDNCLKTSKKNESIYQNLIASMEKLHDKYVESHNSFREKIKKDTCDLSEEMKTLIVTFMLSFKNNYKQPLSYADVTINFFNTLEEGKEIDAIIKEQFKNDNPLKNLTPTYYKLKSFSTIKEANNDDYKNKKGNKKETIKKKRTISKLEDGFDSMQYISDASLISTIKDIFDNFTYIDKEDFNFEKEESKSRTQRYILKIEANMNAYPFAKFGINETKKRNPEVNAQYKRDELTQDEILDLQKLLDDHENRIIFVQKLSDYRTLGKFFVCLEDYSLISKFFNIILDKVKRDLDYHSAEMVIILSQTYCIEDGGKKKYIQENLKNNELIKDRHFWEEFLCYAINKEIMKTLNRDEKKRESKQNSDVKFSNVVFSQLLTLIDNMYEFNVDSNDIKEILGPKISYYKLNDALKNTINDVITSKEAERAIQREEQNKKKEEEKKEDENKNKDDNEKEKKEEGSEVKDEEKKEKEDNKNEITNNGEEAKKNEGEKIINNEENKEEK